MANKEKPTNPEEWVDIVGYEGLYQVSSFGCIKSNHINKKGAGWQSITPYRDKKGYMRLRLYKDGKGIVRKIHRLVASAFIREPRAREEVNHIDGNKANNWVSNLEWCTGKGNMQHAAAMGLLIPPKGEANGRAKLTAEDVIQIRALAAGGKHFREIAELFPINAATTHKIINRKLWT